MEVEQEEERRKKSEEQKGDIPLGWRWLEMEDPWTRKTVRMKLPLEETERRQQYYMTAPAEAQREGERGRGDIQKKGKEGTVVQLREIEPVEWTIYVYPKGEDLWRKGGRPVPSNQSMMPTEGERA